MMKMCVLLTGPAPGTGTSVCGTEGSIPVCHSVQQAAIVRLHSFPTIAFTRWSTRQQDCRSGPIAFVATHSEILATSYRSVALTGFDLLSYVCPIVIF